MKLKEGLPQLMGKRICGAVLKEGRRSPRMQVFLIFDDDTHYEFYSDSSISGIGGAASGNIDRVRQYLPEQKIVFECEAGPPHQSLDLFSPKY